MDTVTVALAKKVVNKRIAQAESYSTTETLTGGKWIDGKPIYKKIIDFGTMPNTTLKNMPIGVSNIASLVSIKGIAYLGTISFVPIPYVNTDGNNIQIWYSEGDLSIRTTHDWSPYSAYIIVEYTKSTD